MGSLHRLDIIRSITRGGEQRPTTYRRQQYYMIMRTINPKRILIFYDEPILFTATDAVESLYLCLLSSIPDEYDCTAIRISHSRLTEYLSKRVDLRTVFTHPEIPGEHFRVTADGEERLILSPLDEKDPTEDRLPEEGDYYNGETQTHNFPIQSAPYPRPDKQMSWRKENAKFTNWSREQKCIYAFV